MGMLACRSCCLANSTTGVGFAKPACWYENCSHARCRQAWCWPLRTEDAHAKGVRIRALSSLATTKLVAIPDMLLLAEHLLQHLAERSMSSSRGNRTTTCTRR